MGPEIMEEILSRKLSVRGNINIIPGAGCDDQHQWMSLADVARETGIDRTSIFARILSHDLIAIKSEGRWWIRIKSVTHLVESYRYGKLKTRTGKRWSSEDLDILTSNITHNQAAAMLDRSSRAVAVKRCKEGLCRAIK